MREDLIIISATNFYYWFSDPLKSKELEKNLVAALNSNFPIDGYELYAPFEELGLWAASLKNKDYKLPGCLSYFSKESAKHILENGKNTLHIPKLADIKKGTEKELVDALKTIYQETGINDFTTHPDECEIERIAKIASLLPENIRFSLENMDPRKKDYKSINEISAVLHNIKNTSLTFDLCHWIENGYSLDSLQLNLFFQKFGDRVNKIHYSVPKTEWKLYGEYPEIETSHFLTINSNQEISINFINQLVASTAWIIEGVVPAGHFELALKEALELRTLIDNHTKFAKAA